MQPRSQLVSPTSPTPGPGSTHLEERRELSDAPSTSCAIAGRPGPAGGPGADRRWQDAGAAAAAVRSSAAPAASAATLERYQHRQRPASTDTSSCGPKPGVKATGTPINIGTIDTKQPGTDFTRRAEHDHGVLQLRQRQRRRQRPPDEAVRRATTRRSRRRSRRPPSKLIQTDHVVGIDGVFDLLECTIDQAYWKQLGIYEMGAGIAPECWSTPNSAAVNMGPRYSSDGAVQYGLSQQGRRRSCSCSQTSRAPATSPPVPRRWRRPRNVPITAADRERADQRRQLGRAQPRRRGRPERLGGAQLHPARGAGDPAGRAEARPRGPGQGHGAARRRATPTSWPRRWDRSGTTSCSSTPS